MANFFERMDYDKAQHLQQLSRLIYQSREYRNAVLAPYGVDDEAALLAQICDGTLPEHPAYEHYLAARILTDTRETARAMIAGGDAEPPSVPLHLELAALVEEEFAAQLASPPEQHLDALVLHLANDLVLTVRYAASDAYSMRWRRADDEAGIDTAPVHPALATRPQHLHDAKGHAVADPLSAPDRCPAENLRALLRALLAEPIPGFP